MLKIIKVISCCKNEQIFCTVFVLDTLDDKIYKCFKLELQAPVVELSTKKGFITSGPDTYQSMFMLPYLLHAR